MSVEPQALGRAVRDLRERAELTQDELGKAADYQKGAAVSISRLESGKAQPGRDRMVKISRALGVTLEELEGLAASPDREAQRLNERPRDREQRVMRELGERKQQLDDATSAFTKAYDRASETFLVKFGRIVESIEGAPPLQSPRPTQTATQQGSLGRASDESIEFDATLAGGVAIAMVAGLLSTGRFSRGVAGLGVAGVGAVAIGVLAESAVSLIASSMKQRGERLRKLDEIEEQLAATSEAADALVSRLPHATELLDYISVHAGHALDRWERGLAESRSWATMDAGSSERFLDFVLIAQTAFAIRIEFEALSSAQKGDDLTRRVKDVEALLSTATEVVTSRV